MPRGAVAVRDFGSDVAVAAAEILDEGMTGGEDPRCAVTLQSPHRPQPVLLAPASARNGGESWCLVRGDVVRRALVNGSAGAVVTVDENPVSVMGFAVTAGKIVEIQILLDPERLATLDLSTLRPSP